MEKIALILIYLTWFSISLLRSTSYVHFFCNVHATILRDADFLIWRKVAPDQKAKKPWERGC